MTLTNDRYDVLWHEFVAGDNFTDYGYDDLVGIVRELMGHVYPVLTPYEELYSYLEACADDYYFVPALDALNAESIQDWLDQFHKADEVSTEARSQVADEFVNEYECELLGDEDDNEDYDGPYYDF